jgi:hypothetical protein
VVSFGVCAASGVGVMCGLSVLVIVLLAFMRPRRWAT